MCTKKSAKKRTETSNRMLTKFVSIGSYLPEVGIFGTLITSTKVFSLIICRDELSITLYLQSEINFGSVRMPVNA